MKKNREIRLHVEELENRVVPTAGTPWPYPSGNWSGYSIESAASTVTDVKGSWIVPKVTVSGKGTAYAASWVGIDGSNSSTVEQIGTDSDQVNGKASYYAWYEMYPAYPVYLDGGVGKNHGPSLPIHVGDKIDAEVKYLGGAFILTITATYADNTSASYTTTQILTSAKRSSAEWIMEAPSSSRSVLPLSNFGSETFTNAKATINGTIDGTIGTYLQGTSTVVYKMDIASGYNYRTQTYNYLDRTGELNSAGDSFTVNFGKTDPPPPADGTLKTYGSNNHLVNFQAVVASASVIAIPPSFSSSAISLEISATTPSSANTVNPVLATPTTVLPPEFRAHDAYFSQAGEAQTPFDDLDAGRAEGEGNLGTGLPWFGLPSTVAPQAINGKSMSGGPRFEASAEPVLSPGITPQATPAFLEGPQIERMIGALALVIALQGMQAPKGREQPAWPRQRPEKEYLPG